MPDKIVALNVDFNDEILTCEEFGYSQYDEDKIRLLVEMVSNSGFNRMLWLDLWTAEWRTNPTYMERFGHPATPWHRSACADTKPPEVIEKMTSATLASAADGLTLHEAQNIEWFSLWKTIKDVAT